MRYIVSSMVVVALSVIALAGWLMTRERPQSLITGDFAAAQAAAEASGARLIIVVDQSPPFL